ncbi:TlpA family protein disulfide reductase [Sphingobacterium faecium]|jgi:thiol-disulfide isomerase/thioredoxin|uniref:TlpA family protein disulfide reductase n=1 Tax=Sphingobacterium faecium TaxID=34087 RepID=UPI0004E5FD72|nr:TlpA disulfide reductase family protein [Sphingobacterium faecium]WGQ15404.1 TlpA disulfide reductase family protein [Sphingobacterium faecium]CDS91573.1 Redoxin domain protein [Sphingobacterium sp. PM2-P1-29]
MRVYKKNLSWIIMAAGLFFSSFIDSDGIADTMPTSKGMYDVLFQNHAGIEINLQDLKGKVVVINYWARWCAPCIAEMPALNQLYVELKSNKNIVFMAVDMDRSMNKAIRFMEKRKYSIPVYQINSPLPEDIATRYIPTTIILDIKGFLVNKHVGAMNFKSIKFKEALQQLSEEL